MTRCFARRRGRCRGRPGRVSPSRGGLDRQFVIDQRPAVRLLAIRFWGDLAGSVIACPFASHLSCGSSSTTSLRQPVGHARRRLNGGGVPGPSAGGSTTAQRHRTAGSGRAEALRDRPRGGGHAPGGGADWSGIRRRSRRWRRPGAGSSEGGLVFARVQDEGLIELAGHGGQPPYHAKIQRHAGGQGFESPEFRWSETQLESPGAEYSSEGTAARRDDVFPG